MRGGTTIAFPGVLTGVLLKVLSSFFEEEVAKLEPSAAPPLSGVLGPWQT